MLEEHGGMNGEFSREFQNLVKYFPDKSVNKSAFRIKTRTNVLTPQVGSAVKWNGELKDEWTQ